MRVRVVCGGDACPIVGAYGSVKAAAPLALINSVGLLEVAVNRGRACDVLSVGVGTEVKVMSGSNAAERLE